MTMQGYHEHFTNNGMKMPLTNTPYKYDFQVITDIDGLAEFLSTTKSNLRNKAQWRAFPHVFVGRSRDLRTARFNLQDVWEFLTANRGINYGRDAGQGNREMDVQVSVSRDSIPAKRIRNQGQGDPGRRTKTRRDTRTDREDPFNLLCGVKH
jgi:hypothetical protein